jgi:hypothetical protein
MEVRMRNHGFFWMLALVLLCAMTAAAADISGKWNAQVPGRGGQAMDTTFTFKVSGEKLTGTVSMQFGDQEISDGKVTGDDVAFVTVIDFGGNTLKFITGKVAARLVHRTMEGAVPAVVDPAPVEFVAKKAA